MKYLLIFFILFSCSVLANNLPENHIFPATILNVIDGDTMDVEIDMSLGIKFNARVRIKDFDSPETWRPSNETEKEHGIMATNFSKNLLQGYANKVQLRIYGWGVYNRVESDIILPSGEDYKDVMIKNGFQKRTNY